MNMVRKLKRLPVTRGFTTGVYRLRGQNFRDLTGRMNFSNDDFIRTTEPRHREACQKLWDMLVERGHITLGAMQGGMLSVTRLSTPKRKLLMKPQPAHRSNGLRSHPTSRPLKMAGAVVGVL